MKKRMLIGTIALGVLLVGLGAFPFRFARESAQPGIWVPRVRVMLRCITAAVAPVLHKRR